MQIIHPSILSIYYIILLQNVKVIFSTLWHFWFVCLFVSIINNWNVSDMHDAHTHMHCPDILTKFIILQMYCCCCCCLGPKTLGIYRVPHPRIHNDFISFCFVLFVVFNVYQIWNSDEQIFNRFSGSFSGWYHTHTHTHWLSMTRLKTLIIITLKFTLKSSSPLSSPLSSTLQNRKQTNKKNIIDLNWINNFISISIYY